MSYLGMQGAGSHRVGHNMTELGVFSKSVLCCNLIVKYTAAWLSDFDSDFL